MYNPEHFLLQLNTKMLKLVHHVYNNDLESSIDELKKKKTKTTHHCKLDDGEIMNYMT